MWNPFSKKKIDRELDECYDVLNSLPLDSKEYALLLGYIERLNKIKEESKPPRVKPEVYVQGMFTISGILLVLYFEKVDTVASKAWNMIFKGRV